MIQEKDFLYRVPVKTAPITTPKGQIRNPEILVDLEGGEFMHGNILDANSTNKLINQSVKEAVDNKIIESGYVTKDLLDAETNARTNGDEDLNAKIKAEQTRAENKEKEISDKLAIVDGDSNTEGSFRKAIADVIAAAPEDLDTLKEIADKLAGNDDLHTALNQAITEKADASALANEVTRATSAESNLQAAIDAKQDAGNYIPYNPEYSDEYLIDKLINMQYGNKGITIRPDFIAFGGEDLSEATTLTRSELYFTDLIGSDASTTYSLSGITSRKYNNCLATSDGSFKPISDFVLKSELPTVPTKTSQLTNDSNFITAADVDFTPYATIEALTAVEQKVDANTNAITNVTVSKGIPYDDSVTDSYQIDKNLTVKIDDTNFAKITPSYISFTNGGRLFTVNPNQLKHVANFYTFEVNKDDGITLSQLDDSDDSNALKLSYNGLRIGEKADINADNGELIYISRQHNTIPYIFKVKDNAIETNKVKIDEFGLTNDKPSTGNSSHALYITNSALHGAILVKSNADLSIGYDNSILDRPFWKFGSQGAEFNGYDDKKRIDIQGAGSEYANIFGIKLSTNVQQSSGTWDDPCQIQNNSDYVLFSKKIKVSDIITDATTDSSLNTVLSKKVNTETFNSFSSYVSGQLSSFNGAISAFEGALSTFGEQIASKQDKITPTTELDLTSIDTADVESLRSIVKALATELNTLGLIKLKSAEETA